MLESMRRRTYVEGRVNVFCSVERLLATENAQRGGAARRRTKAVGVEGETEHIARDERSQPLGDGHVDVRQLHVACRVGRVSEIVVCEGNELGPTEESA